MLAPSSPERAPVHVAAWLFVLAFGFLFLFPTLFLRGMSIDGVTFAAISRNLAVGEGDFWHPVYTATLHHEFHEHPPLAFFLESLLFRMLGDQWWVERLYSLFTVLPTVAILVLTWKRILKHTPALADFSWLPIGLWVLMPGWAWIYRNNFLENTLGVFTALAIYAALRALDTSRWSIAWTALAAGSIVAAVLSKGPVGLFPVVTPVVAWMTMRPASLRKTLFVEGTLLALLSAALVLMLSQPEPRTFLVTYFQQQVVNSLQGRREIVDSRLSQLYLLREVPNHLLLPGALAASLVFLGRKWSESARVTELRGPAMFCWLTAISASMPIMISPKQSAYYSAASWPFYTMAIALWCLPATSALIARWGDSARFVRLLGALRWASVSAIALCVAFSPLWFGRAVRDRELMADVNRIAEHVGPHNRVSIAPELWNQWSLHAYLYRFHYISLEFDEAQPYRLEFVDAPPGELPPGCTVEATELRHYRLYKTDRIATSPQARQQ